MSSDGVANFGNITKIDGVANFGNMIKIDGVAAPGRSSGLHLPRPSGGLSCFDVTATRGENMDEHEYMDQQS